MPRGVNANDIAENYGIPVPLLAITEHSHCDQSGLCPVREPLRKVHEGILGLLSGITIADLCQEDARSFSNIQIERIESK